MEIRFFAISMVIYHKLSEGPYYHFSSIANSDGNSNDLSSSGIFEKHSVLYQIQNKSFMLGCVLLIFYL